MLLSEVLILLGLNAAILSVVMPEVKDSAAGRKVL